jgi:hypothetical protein
MRIRCYPPERSEESEFSGGFTESASMKRFVAAPLLLVFGLLVPGCPIYGSDGGCATDSDCPDSYLCDDLVGSCRPNNCASPSDCPSNQTCSRAGSCRAGDCSWADIGCVAGFVCSSRTGTWECLRSGAAGGESAGGAAGSNAGGASGNASAGSAGSGEMSGGSPNTASGGSGGAI